MLLSYSAIHLKKMTKSANIIKKAWLEKHPRNCPICMDSMDNRGVVDTPCKHKFCLECYTKLEDPRCPLCRSDIPLGILGPYLHNERERTTHNRILEDEWYANSDHSRDIDDFARNPLIFIGNLIDNFTRDLQNYTRPTTHLPTLPAISGYGYIMIGLLIISLFSPYISLYVLILLFIMHLPNANHPASNLYESLLNIFPRPYQVPPTRTPTRVRGSTPPPTRVRGSTPPPRRARTQTFGEIFEGFIHDQLSMTPMQRGLAYARPYIPEEVMSPMHHNLHARPYPTAHFLDRRNN